MQHEIATASDEACQEYKASTLVDLQTPKDVWEVMDKAAKAAIKTIRSQEFEKLLAVADPKNGDQFIAEVFKSVRSLM